MKIDSEQGVVTKTTDSHDSNNNQIEKRGCEDTLDFASERARESERILDTFINMGNYVVDAKTHEVLFFNKRFKEMCPDVELGMICSDLNRSPCKDCLLNVIGERAMAHKTVYSESYGDIVEMSAVKMLWKGTRPAIVMNAWPRDINDFVTEDSLVQRPNSTHDYITGGLLRTGFIDAVERIKRNRIDLTDYSIVFINITNFKAVNEMMGCLGGDNLLREFYTRIAHSTLNPIIGARTQADHFSFFIEKEKLKLDTLPELLNFQWEYQGRKIFVHCRAGIFNIDDADLEVYKMMDRAKLAKEHIVDEYVKPFEIYDDTMIREYSETTSNFFSFNKAIKNKEFVVYFQPIIDTKTEKIVAAEALVRRIDENGNIIMPGKFIPILEHTGYISKLDRFVADEVRNTLYMWKEKGVPIIPISFNLSQKDFYDTDLLEYLAHNMETSTLPKGSVLVEITETAYVMHERTHDKFIQKLCNSGGKLLLDDFGSGYSSFAMFEDYNFDRVKLDRGFVSQLLTNKNMKTVLEAIVSMCHKLDMSVVAEGVEKKAEVEMLREIGCDYIQGYYYAKPMPLAELESYIKEHI